MNQETLNVIRSLINKHKAAPVDMRYEIVQDIYSLAGQDITADGLYFILDDLLKALGEGTLPEEV